MRIGEACAALFGLTLALAYILGAPLWVRALSAGLAVVPGAVSFGIAIGEFVTSRSLSRVLLVPYARIPPVQSPSTLLRSEYGVVPFVDRPELDTLLAWCLDPNAEPVRLIVGPSMAGKTRLAAEMCARLSVERNWIAGFLLRRQGVEGLQRIDLRNRPSLVVVDSADTAEISTERGDGLVDLIAHTVDRPAGGPLLRLLLISRVAGEWWSTISQVPGSAEKVQRAIGAGQPLQVTGLTLSPSEWQSAYVEARDAFRMVSMPSKETSRNRTTVGTRWHVTPASGEDRPLPLALAHLAGLLDARRNRRRSVILTGAHGIDEERLRIVRNLLDEEEGYWVASAAARHLGDLDRDTVRGGIALGTLRGAGDRHDAAALLKDLYADALTKRETTRFARWLHSLYPGDNDIGGWLPPLRPELLAELLVADVIGRADDFRISLSDVPLDIAARALVLLTAATRYSPAVVPFLRSVLAADLERLAPLAVRLVPVTGEPLGQILAAAIDLPQNQDVRFPGLLETIPEMSVSLSEVAISVCRGMLRDPESAGDELASGRLLVRIGTELEVLDRWEEMAQYFERAAAEWRKVGDDRSVAGCLGALAKALAWQGRVDAAYPVVREATDLARRLAADTPDWFNKHLLANCIAVYIDCLERRREYETLIDLAQEDVTIRRDLDAARRSCPDRQMLATSLLGLSNAYAHVSMWAEAREAATECLDMRRALAAKAHEGVLREFTRAELARALSQLALCVAHMDEVDAAERLLEESLEYYYDLAKERPAQFGPELAQVLISNGTLLGWKADIGRANARFDDAIAVCRTLVPHTIDPYYVPLADALRARAEGARVLHGRNAELPLLEEERRLREEAVALLRAVAAAHTDRLPKLVKALIELGDVCERQHDATQAVATVVEAIDILIPLAAADPVTFGSDLAQARQRLATISHQPPSLELPRPGSTSIGPRGWVVSSSVVDPWRTKS